MAKNTSDYSKLMSPDLKTTLALMLSFLDSVLGAKHLHSLFAAGFFNFLAITGPFPSHHRPPTVLQLLPEQILSCALFAVRIIVPKYFIRKFGGL